MGERLTARFRDALSFAAQVHEADTRKGSGVPYVAHLLGVAALVLLDGGDEDEAIAALLHDTLEDHGREVTRADLRARFGPRVARLVEDCTDTPPDYAGGEKPPWRARKTAYLAHVEASEPARLRVSLADKVDNARAIVADLRTVGDRVWRRFQAGEAEQLWYYRSLVAAYRKAGVRGPLLDELDRTVTEMERLAAETRGAGAA